MLNPFPDTTTQMIETIWPLSVLSCTRDNALGKDQNLIGLRVFVQEVLRRSKTSYSTLQVALYYLVLIQSCIPKHDFTMEQAEDSPSCRAMQCGRRMFLAALILASKYLQDRNFSARAWSKISGLKTFEINSNEMAFLAAVNWKLHIPEPVYNRWTDIVFKYSPSSQPSGPSRPLTSNMWKAIIPHLTPDLDQVPFGYATICNDSGYREADSPSATASPPRHTVLSHSEVSDHRADIPYTTPVIPRTLEPPPLGTEMKGHTLPPLPRLGLLPTPSMTPDARPFCAPAASTFNPCSGRSSMSIAMAQAQTNSLARSTLDNPNFWKPALPEPFPTSARRSSLAQSVYSVSSPESMISDFSARSSRSSSISSVASSSCALPQARLAVQATRRCANLKLASRKDSYRAFVRLSPSEDTPWEVQTASPDQIENDYFSRPIHYSSRLEGKASSDPGSTPSASTREAAAALRDLALNHLVLPLPAGMSNSRKRERSHSVQLTDRGSNIPESIINAPYNFSRKRERTLSSELSVQANVRELIAPRCVNDVLTSSRRGSEDDGIVLQDTRLADSFLVPQSINFEPKSSGVVTASITPRKRACCATDSNKEESGRIIDHLLEERAVNPGPGMWDILC